MRITEIKMADSERELLDQRARFEFPGKDGQFIEEEKKGSDL